MDLKLIRKQSSSDGIFSELRNFSDRLIAVTLEHAYWINDKWLPKIPHGEYVCIRGLHRLERMKHDFTTFEITGVPNHTNLLFHVGNYNFDSDGCVLLGEEIEGPKSHYWIKNSQAAFQKFMLIQDMNLFKLTVQ